VTHHGPIAGCRLERSGSAPFLWGDEAIEYIRTRSRRRRNDHDVQPEWATEAATLRGAEASWAPPPEGSAAIESESLLVLGYSPTAEAVLKVWLRPIDMQAGDWVGVNAAFAKARLAKGFLERSKQ
jgi:hypothetical protein